MGSVNRRASKVGCLYLESAFSHCEKCTSTVCDTCFLDTQDPGQHACITMNGKIDLKTWPCKDWLIKEWYPQHTIWTSCVWLWPIDQALALDERPAAQQMFERVQKLSSRGRLGGPDAGAAGEGRSKRTDTERWGPHVCSFGLAGRWASTG